MPYWNPEELLEDYLNLALHLSGSAFRVESMAASAHKAPEAAVHLHTAPEMVASAHGSPEAALPAHILREAVDFADVSSETAVFAHTAHEAPYAAI